MFQEGAFFSLSHCRLLLTVCLIAYLSAPGATEQMATLCYAQANIAIPEPICFLLTDTRMQYVAAKNACATLNEGRLINLQTYGKHQIFEALRDMHSSNMDDMDYWLGLVRIPGTNDWKWSDGNQSLLSYDNWASGEPNLGDPLSTVTSVNSDDSWKSNRVLDEHFLFCEFSPTSGNPLAWSSPPHGPSSTTTPGPHAQFQSFDFQYHRTTYIPSSFQTSISTSRSVLECAAWCSGTITCYGFGVHIGRSDCIVFSLDVTAQLPIPDCASERCYHKLNLLQVL